MAPPRRAITRLGERLRDARTALNFGQLDLAKRAHVSSRQVSRWENGQRPTVDEAQRIFDVLSSAPAPVVEALAAELGIELPEVEEPVPQPAALVAPPPAPVPPPPAPVAAPVPPVPPPPPRPTVAELRASFDALLFATAEDRDVLPRHLRAFAVSLFQAADGLGVSARDAALLVALPERAEPETHTPA